MFKQLIRKVVPNPFERLLKRAQKKGQKRILLAWNRGLGDIALGLCAIVHRIKQRIPDAEVTFITRENLKEGFSLLEGVSVLTVPSWRRGAPYPIAQGLIEIGKDLSAYDLLIEQPDPTYWVSWQRGTFTPRLKWNSAWDDLFKKYGLQEDLIYIGVQPQTETNYGFGRNFSIEKWQELFDLCLKKEKVRILLFGFEKKPLFTGEGVIDLRGQTTTYELLSIIKNRCFGLVLLDSGISAMSYFLDVSFPIKLVSLWGDPDMGILKQRVASPNPQLVHIPLLGGEGNINNIAADQIQEALFS
jgi:ADP-heptose:LPS heptosyltransferase